MAKNRVTRDEVIRRRPIRNRAVQASTKFVQDIVDRGPGGTPQTPVAAVQDAVESTVATAYTVIEQYMSRGHSAASRHYGSNGDSAMNDAPFPGAGPGQPPPNGGPSGGAPEGGFGSTGDPWGVNMWMEPWMQMMRMWADGMRMAGGQAGMMNPFASMMGQGANLGVSIEVQSTRPTTVALDLAAGAEAQQLTVGPLRNAGDSAVTLEGVELVSQQGRYSVRLKVSDSQAPGVYVGTVEDAQRRPLGQLNVVITGVAEAREQVSAEKSESGAVERK